LEEQHENLQQQTQFSENTDKYDLSSPTHHQHKLKIKKNIRLRV
jgi:hypothetical protein